MSRIVPNLWYTDKAEEAAAFYVSLLPDSKIDGVTALPADTPSGPAGSVKVVEFTLMGQPFMAISAGPFEPFNHAVSFMVQCDDHENLGAVLLRRSINVEVRFEQRRRITLDAQGIDAHSDFRRCGRL